MNDETVRLMHYDPRWRQEFEQTRSSIFFSCDGWVTAVHHIGSTAISGLIARPTIDAIATVTSTEAMESASLLIEGLNFRREPSPRWAGDAITLVKPRNPPPGQIDPTHRVFIAFEDAVFLRRAIELRDYFRSHPENAIRWEETKVASWRDCEGDLDKYESDKSIFIAHLTDQIEAGKMP